MMYPVILRPGHMHTKAKKEMGQNALNIATNMTYGPLTLTLHMLKITKNMKMGLKRLGYITVIKKKEELGNKGKNKSGRKPK